MSFLLLKLPYLPLDEILKMVDLHDIFTLSVCSSRMSRLVRSVNLKIRKVLFDADLSELKVFSQNFSKDYTFLISSKDIPQLENKHTTTTHLIIDGIKVECTWSNHCITCRSNDLGIVQLAISNHAHKVLKVPQLVDLELSEKNTSENVFPSLKHVTDTLLTEYSSKIDTIENVFFEYSDLKAPILLENFSGRFAVISEGKVYKMSRIINFIESWSSGEKYQNLELLIVTLSTSSQTFDHLKILNRLESITQKWNRLERPENFEYYPRIINSHEKEPLKVQCGDFHDIKRNTDGKLASFDISLYRFIFCVWP